MKDFISRMRYPLAVCTLLVVVSIGAYLIVKNIAGPGVFSKQAKASSINAENPEHSEDGKNAVFMENQKIGEINRIDLDAMQKEKAILKAPKKKSESQTAEKSSEKTVTVTSSQPYLGAGRTKKVPKVREISENGAENRYIEGSSSLSYTKDSSLCNKKAEINTERNISEICTPKNSRKKRISSAKSATDKKNPQPVIAKEVGHKKATPEPVSNELVNTKAPVEQVAMVEIAMMKIVMVEIPMEETPVEVIPAGKIKIVELPMEETPVGKLPVGEIAMKKTPVEKTAMPNSISNNSAPNELAVQPVPVTNKPVPLIESAPINIIPPSESTPINAIPDNQSLLDASIPPSKPVSDPDQTIPLSIPLGTPPPKDTLHESIPETSPEQAPASSQVQPKRRAISKNGNIGKSLSKENSSSKISSRSKSPNSNPEKKKRWDTSPPRTEKYYKPTLAPKSNVPKLSIGTITKHEGVKSKVRRFIQGGAQEKKTDLESPKKNVRKEDKKRNSV